MATQVEIFKIEFGGTEASINAVKKALKDAKDALNGLNVENEKTKFVNQASEVKRLEGVLKTLNAVTKENTNALGGVNQATQFASGSYGELKQKIETTKKSLLELNVESEDFANTQKDLIALQEQRIAIEKKIPSLFQERIKLAIDESNSLKQLKIDLKNAQSAALNGDSKAAEKVAELKDKIDDLKDSTKSLQGSGVERLNTSMNLLTDSFANFDGEKFTTAFKGIGSAMSAIPIFLVIEGVKLLIDNFDKVAEFSQRLFGSLNSNAQAVKNLTNEIEAQQSATILLEATISSEIELMEAQGASIDMIIEKKRELAVVQVSEQKRNLELQLLQLNQAETEVSTYDKVKEATLLLMGAKTQAIMVEGEAEKERQIKINGINKQIAETEANIIKIATGFKIETIKATAKKEIELKKETSIEVKKVDKDYSEYQQKLYEDEVKALDDKFEAQLKAQENYNNEQAKLVQDEIDASDKAYQDAFKDDITRAKNNLRFVEKNGGDILKANQDLLIAERNEKLNNDKLTNEERLLIANEYLDKEKQLKLNAQVAELESYKQLATGIQSVTNELFEIKRNHYKKDADERILADVNATAIEKEQAQKRLDDDKRLAKKQFDLNKAFSIATSQIQAAQAIISASASVPFIPVGLAAVVGASALGAANLIKIANQKFEYFDGGFTGDGNIHDASTNVGSKPYTYHKGEYIVPNKVLKTSEGSIMVSQLEAMRKGFSTTGISGFFDGGFTARSNSAQALNSSMSDKKLEGLIKSLPTPIVRVTDINDVNTTNTTTVNISSL